MFVLGVVPYLNAVPLTAELRGQVELVADVPSRLGHHLDAGDVDAALLPVYEALNGSGDGYLGTYGIASRGPVASVLLFLRRPLADVRTLVLDPASRTSAALARHVVTQRVQGPLRVRLADRPGPDPEATEGDAVLVIGDAALQAGLRWGGEVLDLGEEWTRETGLPFVYARWTARRGLDDRTRRCLAELLDRAAAGGLARRAELAKAWALQRGQDAEVAARYVLRNVWYHLGPDEEAGLARYAEIVRPRGGTAVEVGHA